MTKETYMMIPMQEPDEDGRSTILIPIDKWNRMQKVKSTIALAISIINIVAIFAIILKMFCFIISPSNMVAAVMCTIFIELITLCVAYGLYELVQKLKKLIS